MNKMILSITLTILFSTNAYAFTKIDTFDCLKGEVQVEVKKSFSPDGIYMYSADSEQVGQLRSMECKILHKKWGNYGSENCYANDNYLFSHHGDLGIISFFKSNFKYFGLCQKIKSIQ